MTGNRITKLMMPSTLLNNIPITAVLANDVKVAELYGVMPFGSIQNGVVWSDGLSKIVADTGSNSSFRFEGWNESGGLSSWKSVLVQFIDSCGSI